MTLQPASLLLAYACICLATLIAAATPAQLHEARQGSIDPLSLGPGPVSIRTTPLTSSTPQSTTMSPTPTSKPSSSSSSSISPLPLSSPSNNPSPPSSPSGTLASHSTSSAAPQPSSSSTNGLSFTVQNMTTCSSGLISWTYDGQEAELLLSITNIGVPQDDVEIVTQEQLADTDTSARSFTWPSVNLTQGWYEIEGLVLSSLVVRNNSAPFFISNGTDVTCLTGASPQASSTASSAVRVASKSKVASIAGGVVGGLVGVTLAVFAGVFFCLRRRKALLIGGGRKGGAWGSLKSTSSSINPGDGGAQFTNNRFHSHSESSGAILQDIAGGKASATTTPGGSDEDVIVVSGEKLVSPAPSPGMSPFEALNTPVHYDRRTSVYSIQTPTVVATDPLHSRVPSIRTPNQNLEQQAQRIRCSMETSVRHRGDRLSMPTLPSPNLPRVTHSPTHTQTKEKFPLTSVTPSPVNRSISAGGASLSARRSSRKPVPHYDSSLLVEDKSADSVSTFTGGAESSQSHGAGLGTGGYGTQSDLTHKASFGDGRPVHYLIPDMPPPQRD